MGHATELAAKVVSAKVASRNYCKVESSYYKTFKEIKEGGNQGN